MAGKFTATQIEPDTTWFDIAVDHQRECFVMGCSSGWNDFGIAHRWADAFMTDPPAHLAPGWYRWMHFSIGSLGEGSRLDITGGDFLSARDPMPEAEAVAYRYVYHDHAGRKISRYGTEPGQLNGRGPLEVHPLYAQAPRLPDVGLVASVIHEWLAPADQRVGEWERNFAKALIAAMHGVDDG